ncbi:MAG: ArsC/Spx/MgsR family protein [Paracoccaceae bacterium]
MILYGLSGCDTCRKALAAIRAAGRDVEFRDIRAEPLSADERREMLFVFGDRLINRVSATWRALSEAERMLDAGQLLAAHPALMKRPVIRDGASFHIGWKPETQALVLK